MASIEFTAFRSTRKWCRPPVSLTSVSGNITFAISKPAGAPSTDAVTMWPALIVGSPA